LIWFVGFGFINCFNYRFWWRKEINIQIIFLLFIAFFLTLLPNALSTVIAIFDNHGCKLCIFVLLYYVKK